MPDLNDEHDDNSHDDTSRAGIKTGSLIQQHEEDSPKNFFLKLVNKIFKNINFFNLLYDQNSQNI